ncbi:hypothetical protein Voc01_028050 [Virgisporangium ochraceum]|uniref:Uncharacterized protein n=1 Tax=Virgisporangium ochraceum TaxID=65505 RepID=A0A8J4EAY0_9ACTN|nr:hypothetical protein Voc01_028050 [Virgisporangium ochraceum]
MPVRWISVRPGFIPLWDDDEADIEDWSVDELDKPDELVEVLRILLGGADPAALAEFDRLHNDGWRQSPPQWTGERLRRFSAVTGRVPDPRGPVEGYWELADATVADLAPKLPWTQRYVGRPVEEVRRSIRLEWLGAYGLHQFLADAVAGGNEVVAD